MLNYGEIYFVLSDIQGGLLNIGVKHTCTLAATYFDMLLVCSREPCDCRSYNVHSVDQFGFRSHDGSLPVFGRVSNGLTLFHTGIPVKKIAGSTGIPQITLKQFIPCLIPVLTVYI